MIEPLLPNKPRDALRVDDRRVLNGIFWVLSTGPPWRDLPERYGPNATCNNWFNRSRLAGVSDRLMDAIVAACRADRIREHIEDHEAVPIMPDRSNGNERHGFSPTPYRLRNSVEFFFNNINYIRRNATR